MKLQYQKPTQLAKIKVTTVAAVLTAGLAVPAQAQTDLVVVSWGGAYSRSQQKAYHDPYMARNPNIRIINDDSSGEAAPKLRAMNEARNVTWALVDAEAGPAIEMCDEGLVEEVDHDSLLAPAPDGTPASEDFGEFIVSPCFIPQIVYSTTWAYRTDLLKRKPKSIKDVFNLKKFPGKRAMLKKPVNNLEWALIADGVRASKVYEVLSTEKGVARAFKKLDTIKDHIVWADSGAQPPQLLADGEVVIASSFNGRFFSAIEEDKQPIAMMWDHQIFDLDGWVIPRGGPHQAEVRKYLRFATDTQRLADQAKYISYAPTRKSSTPLVGKHAELGIDMAPHMPTDPKNAKKTLLIDYQFWADNRQDLDEQFNAWLAR